ncbi:hypothetical protein AKJ16_DCAP03499 [Drosera capensis]
MGTRNLELQAWLIPVFSGDDSQCDHFIIEGSVVSMSAEWNTPRLPLEALGVGPFHVGAVNNMADITSFYPQGNSARTISLPGYPGNISNNNPVVASVSDSSVSRHMVRDSGGAILVDSTPELNGIHNSDTSTAVDWSPSEQQLLQEGLVKFADEPSIMKYIKIAATLREKTVRDVALRCKWMMGKRRKQHEAHARKANCRKSHNHDPIYLQVCMIQLDIHFKLLIGNKEKDPAEPHKNEALINSSRKFFEEISAILKEMPGRISLLPKLPSWYGQEHSSVNDASVQPLMYYTANVLGRQQEKREPQCDGLSNDSIIQTGSEFPPAMVPCIHM